MTQHRWKTTDGFDVMTGWDRPLQHYFFQISRLCPSCQGEGETETGAECFSCGGRGEQYVFDNLDAREFVDNIGGMDIEQVAFAMDKYLTEVPPTVLSTLALEQLTDEGNKIEQHDTIGTVKL